MLALQEVAGRSADVFAGMPIDRAYVFGSYARGDANEGSDVDICYDRTPGEHFGMQAFLGLKRSLEHALGLPVDLHEAPTPATARSKVFFDEVMRDRRLIYEREAI